MPNDETFDSSRLIGIVHLSVSALKLPTLSDCTVMVNAVLVVYARNGWTNIWFTSARSVLPAHDQTCFQRAPTVHGPACFSATIVGPALHFSVPSVGSAVEGRLITGPTPQVNVL